MSTEDVIFFEHPSSDGSVVAEARLNIPPTLNALTLDAVEVMTPKMKDWAERDEVAAVIVTGEGDRLFAQEVMFKLFIMPPLKTWRLAVR